MKYVRRPHTRIAVYLADGVARAAITTRTAHTAYRIAVTVCARVSETFVFPIYTVLTFEDVRQ
jgi:hypothetical protein